MRINPVPGVSTSTPVLMNVRPHTPIATYFTSNPVGHVATVSRQEADVKVIVGIGNQTALQVNGVFYDFTGN